MKIALIQLNIVWQDKERNFAKVEKLAAEAASQSCKLIVLPEMFNTGFSMNIGIIGEPFESETYHFLQGIARRYNINVIGGYPTFGENKKGKNIAVAFESSGKQIAQYAKIHPFSFAGEHNYYEPGESPCLFTLDEIPGSIFICYDLRFPEVFRQVARSVYFIFVIANWPASRVEHWKALLKARAIENQCFVIGVNRTGVDGNGLVYSGDSLIISPFGEERCQGNDKDELVIGEIDADEVVKIRQQFPFLSDMK